MASGRPTGGREAPRADVVGPRNTGVVHWPRMGLLEGNRRGQLPWRPRRRSLLITLPLALLVPLVWWATAHIERDVEQAAPEILRAAGVDHTTLEFSASYRNIEVSGVLPPGVTAEEVERLLELGSGPAEGEDIRSAKVVAVEAPAAALGAIDVRVTSDGDTVVLTGTVPSVELRDVLVTAANASGLSVVANITNSGLAPSSGDAAAQIAKLADLLALLGLATTADLEVGDEGTVRGSLQSLNAESATRIERVAGDGVTVGSLLELGSLDVQVTYDGTRIVFTGDVLTQMQSDELVDAAAEVAGRGRVVDNMTILELGEATPGADLRIAALVSAVRTFDGLTMGDARLNDTDLTVNGEAVDVDAQAATSSALQAAAGADLRPGGDLTLAEVTLSLQEEIDLLQTDLDALQSEIRETVIFGSDSTDLSDAAAATLDKVVEAMELYPNPVVEVSGHTDSLGAEDYNLSLSQLRAEAVVAYLETRGIAAERLSPEGFGESVPIADNGTEEGRFENRRVEFRAQESF